MVEGRRLKVFGKVCEFMADILGDMEPVLVMLPPLVLRIRGLMRVLRALDVTDADDDDDGD